MPQQPMTVPAEDQSRISIALKVAARRIGIATEEYLARIGAGEKWCFRCKAWHPREMFALDASRGDGLRPSCKQSLRSAIPPTFSPIEGETWKPIPGYEGLYEASDRCRIRKIKDEPRKKRAPYEVKQHRIDGYRYLVLYRDGEWIHVGVHILVCLAFNGLPPAEGMEVNHKDGVPGNDHPDNLEWVTRRYNCLHAYAMGLSVPQRGEENGNSRLTEFAVKEILALEGIVPRRALARRFHVSSTVIRKIHRGDLWAHLRQMPMSREFPAVAAAVPS